jgi:uncharacterized Tic20 family protein
MMASAGARLLARLGVMMEAGTGSIEAIPREARNWAMGCHLMALVGLLGNGLGFVVGPLIVWLVKREDHPYVDEQGKEAVNFQLTMLGAAILAALSLFILVGFVLLPLVCVFDVVVTIIAGVKAANGEPWRYPLSIRIIK